MTILAGKPNPYTVVTLKKDTVLLRVPESNFDVFIQENHQNAIMIMKTMARNLAMVNMNMNLLVEELREISKDETVDEGAVKRLAEQYGGHIEVSTVSEPLEETETEAALELPNGEIYLPGHKGYPGIIHPEYRKSVYQKEYTCPNCGKTFTSWRIFRSKLVVLPEKGNWNVWRQNKLHRPCWNCWRSRDRALPNGKKRFWTSPPCTGKPEMLRRPENGLCA